ncbi:MAG: SGNH/GDSL hydrolase family protein [Armatimonadota bacterium]|nr:SGNH/GDSL hydrolase family protein [Armatimonadota bacterium]
MKTLLCCTLLMSLCLATARIVLTGTENSQAETPKEETPKEVLPVTIFKNLKAGKKQTVIVYGTSLTVGGAWAKALKEYFDKHFPDQVKFINSGGSGQSSPWGVANLQSKVLEHQPDLVLIEFSYNDAHLKAGTTLEKAAQNLDTMVQSLRQQNPQMDIVLQTMNVPWDAPGDKKPLSNRPRLNDYNDIYRNYAREHDLPLLDHYQNWLKLWQEDPQKYQKWLPDGSHPTTEASLAITWPTIEAMLERARQSAGERNTNGAD